MMSDRDKSFLKKLIRAYKAYKANYMEKPDYDRLRLLIKEFHKRKISLDNDFKDR